MNLLDAKLYDPSTAASKSTASLLAMTAFDTANLRLTVTVPAHGLVRFRLRCTVEGATTFPQVLLGVLNGATVVGRVSPLGALPGTAVATTRMTLDAEFTATGLTPGSTNFDAAYGVEIVVASTNIKYGGPNNTTTDDAWGAFVFEAWDPRPLKLALDGGVNVTQWLGTAVTAATAGIPDVNAKNINNVSTASVTTINANQGTTQPINFTGTAANALVKSDMVDIAGAAVSTTTAQIGVNAVQINAVSTSSVTTINANQGTTQPINFTGSGASALVKSDMVDIAGAAVSTTSAQIGVNCIQWNSLTTVALPLVPTTAGRTLDVSATGEGGVDWANVGGQATAVNLSATTINLVNTTTTVTNRVTANTDQIEGLDATNQIRDSILTDATRFPGADIDATISSRATPADVKTQVVAALATDTYAEPGQSTPAATTTLAAKINFLYKNWRNRKDQTSSTFSLFADDATTVDQKATVSDDGTTASRGEIATGP